MVEAFDLIIHNGTYVTPPGRGCVQACKAGLWMSSDPKPTQIHHRGCPRSNPGSGDAEPRP
jgi:hypothetical protein